MSILNWKINNNDLDIIKGIAERALKEGYLGDKVDLLMDLCCVHDQYALNLKKFLNADEFNFWHDLSGISKHLNRENGKLDMCFLPRHVA